jgi:peptidoglycan/xylan/chitin deacetylase (PgdA/CDA1 family)
MYGVKSLVRCARWARSRFVNRRALILGYHRIDDDPWDPYSLNVAPVHFAQHLDVLQKHANPVSLQTLVDGMRSGNLAPRSVAVTLDDGYVDNLHNAKPILAHRRVPATVFVATGYLGKEFWWDELTRLCGPTKDLPQDLCLKVNGGKFDWRLKGPINARLWKQLVLSLHHFFSPLTEPERCNGLEQLRSVLGTSADDSAVTRAMTSGELRELVTGGLVEVGAHTVSHPFLPKLDIKAQQNEISESKKYLEGLIGRQIESFCYPYGLLTRKTAVVVRDSGFRCACATYSDIVTHGNDPFRLPRFLIPNWNGAQFARWLHRWIDSKTFV